jgi:hypothetical protein
MNSLLLRTTTASLIAASVAIGAANLASAETPTAPAPYPLPVVPLTTPVPPMPVPTFTAPVVHAPFKAVAPRISGPSMVIPAKAPALREVASMQENNAALSEFNQVVGAAVTSGSLMGTTVGAVAGCLVGGALVGTATAVPTIGLLAIPGFLGGCVVTAIPAAGIGAVVGTIAVGGPALLVEGGNLAATHAAPAGTTRYAAH